MSFARTILMLLAVAAPACAKQAQVREPSSPDLFHMCNDPRTQSLCTPLPVEQQPVRIDTNLLGARRAALRA